MPHLHVYTFLYTFAIALSAVGLIVFALPFAILGSLLAYRQHMYAALTPIKNVRLDSSDSSDPAAVGVHP